MLSLQYIREHGDLVRAALERRHVETPLTRILDVDARRRQLLQELEAERGQRNQRSSRIGTTKDPAARQALIDETRSMSSRIGELEPAVKQIEADLDALLLQMPNLPDESIPDGEDAEDNVEVRAWGQPRVFGYPARPHWEIGEELGIIEFERGVKISGSRFQALVGDGAALSRALISLMLEMHIAEHGYTEIAPPYLVRPEAMLGTGQLPKFEDEAYRIERDELYLIPTAEVPLINLHRAEIFEPEVLPIRYCAYSACFRREAGAAGRDTRGLIRVHQFDKVEMVQFVAPKDASAALEAMTGHAEAVLQRLGLPYRIMILCSGDLGLNSRKTYDLEVWMPGQARFVEISSCSTMGDFQSRRADIKYRPEAGAHAEYVHTLNGSGLAVGRTMAALLETYQQEDGTVEIPTALRAYLGGRERLSRRA